MGTLSSELADINIADFIDALFHGGWFEYIFPFMLVYAIVLTILNNVPMFEDKKPVRVIIALVMALFAIAFPISGNFADCGVNDSIYHSSHSDCETLGGLMMSLFPGVTAFSIGVLALYIVAAMLDVDLMEFFGRGENKNNYLKWILGALGLFVVVYYYAVGFGWGGFDEDNWLWGPDGMLRDPLLYIIVIFGGLFYWISKDNDSSGSSKKKDKGVVVKPED